MKGGDIYMSAEDIVSKYGYTEDGVRKPSEELLMRFGVDDSELVGLAVQVAAMRAALTPKTSLRRFSPSRVSGQVVSPGESGAPLD